MKLKYYPYTIVLKEEFTLSAGSRKTTPAVIVEVEHKGQIGYGEASLPPYLSEDQSSVISFLKEVNLSSFSGPENINLILDYVDNIAEGNNSAKASVDIALHDLLGKFLDVPLHKYLGINKRDNIYSLYTIGISDSLKIKQKVEDASEFKF
ncbi:MAG: dipeptide epimerase, partial [Ignavibacteriaceae bacterium]|nr:dipeptide epimerase [Ignavibacteriaceae bacterium]